MQAGAAYDYDDRVGESTEPSWTNTIRDAVKEFVSAVTESSNQLASAAEAFAAESMHSIDDAASRAERSASTSSEMAEVAQQAASAARAAVDGFQSAVEEAGERIRVEASQGAELHVSQVQAAGERLRTDLQGHVDDMISRIENAAGSNQDAIAAAELATNAAREAADRVQQSVAAVEAGVASAQRSAEQAQAAVEQSETRLSAIDEAVRTAREAAEAARQSAEQAGGQSTSLSSEAALLLERLETDYDLLTRLVRELHGRIASLSLPAAPTATSEEAPEAASAGPVGLVDAFDAVVETPEIEAGYETYMSEEPVWEIAQPAIEASSEVADEAGESEKGYSLYVGDDTPAWESSEPLSEVEPEAGIEARKPEAASSQFVDEVPNGAMPAPVSDGSPEAAAEDSEQEIGWPEATEETAWVPGAAAWEKPEQAGHEPSAEPTVEDGPEPVSAMIKGYVQVRIAPVPDFDRLLNLDGALSRVSGVASVTLADYAQEEVTFRVEVLNEKDAVLFTREIGQAAGFETRLIDAADNSVTVRIK